MYDIIIIGSGPAGLSAAITARSRGKSVAVISNDSSGSGLFKAPVIDNYPGLPRISGAELSKRMIDHAISSGAEIITGRITSALKSKSGISVAYGNDMATAKAVIITVGVIQSSVFPGESELLGQGVSYCATCDGMLYRGKKVVVLSLSPEAHEESDYLRSIGCEVTELTTKKVVINGVDKLESITADSKIIQCDAVFILRPSVSPTALLPGLETENGHIKISQNYMTSVEGVFAAGDCIGTPYQIAKAVGEGQLAAFSAIEFIDK